MYDEINKYQLKPSEWWEIGGDLSINKDDRNELRKNELLKDDNRLERVLWLASQQSVLTENKLNHVSKLLHSKQGNSLELVTNNTQAAILMVMHMQIYIYQLMYDQFAFVLGAR